MKKCTLTDEQRKKGQDKIKEIQHDQYLERVRLYNLNPKMCFTCKNPLPYEKKMNKFCCHSCSASSTNVGRRRFGSIFCDGCGEEILGDRRWSSKKYCSHDCYLEHKSKKRWDRISSTGCFSSGARAAKQEAIALKGHKCEICGLTEWRGEKVPLVLDHINGKPSDNRIENIRLVCGNCNMQLPTFAGRNVGKGGGRPYRMKRYYEGKSW